MAGGLITTGSHPQLLWPGIASVWGQMYNEHNKQYVDLYDIRDSDKAYEMDVQVTPFGLAPVKPQGSMVTYDTEIQGTTTRYQHIAYALGYMVSYEEQQDNQYEEVSSNRAAANAFSMTQTIENIAAFPFNNAFSTANFTMADGQSLCSTGHVNASGGTFSNVLSPGADLAESSLEDLCVQAMGLQNDRGLNISVIPQSLHVSRQDWYNANRVYGSVLQSNTSNNNINVLKATNAFPKGIIVNNYFTSPHAFFIRTNVQHGMTLFWRNKPMFRQDNDHDTMNLKAYSYMRFSVGCTDPRGILGSNGP